MSAAPTVLHGMTWNHTRGCLPLVAAAQRFAELHPEIEVVWDKRSLRDFEQFPLARLAADYDLLVIDHPFVGTAAHDGALLPLDEHLPAAFLAEQAAGSVGASHASYNWGGRQWALAIDAATPVACWREDLLERHGLRVPATWEETADLARRGHVETPAAPINCLMNFYALCVALGEEPGATPGRLVSPGIGREALARLRALLTPGEPAVWARTPITSFERLAAADNTRLAYCPLAYGYSNYARAGYADHRLVFGEPPTFRDAPLRTTLGGTGLAVSALRPHRTAALAWTQYAAAPETQRTLCAAAGGQPGHRAAWLDPDNNRLAGGYFTRTLPALERAWLRPRHHGYMTFQEHGGTVVHAALRGNLTDTDALAQLDALHRENFTAEPSAPC